MYTRKIPVSFTVEFEVVEKLMKESSDLKITVSQLIRQMLLDRYGVTPIIKSKKIPPPKKEKPKGKGYVVTSSFDPEYDPLDYDDDYHIQIT